MSANKTTTYVYFHEKSAAATCAEKLTWRTRSKARHQLKLWRSRGKQKLWEYHCDVCGMYHATSKNPKDWNLIRVGKKRKIYVPTITRALAAQLELEDDDDRTHGTTARPHAPKEKQIQETVVAA